jgi:hypothetical protein
MRPPGALDLKKGAKSSDAFLGLQARISRRPSGTSYPQRLCVTLWINAPPALAALHPNLPQLDPVSAPIEFIIHQINDLYTCSYMKL